MAWWWYINIAGNFGLNYDLNYKRRCGLGYKFILTVWYKIKGDEKTAKTDDRLELNSIWN
jgi:hypothetical protein